MKKNVGINVGIIVRLNVRIKMNQTEASLTKRTSAKRTPGKTNTHSKTASGK
jgi:hypothetical protein